MSKKIKTIMRRRMCRFIGCKQILSIYNQDTYCYVHQQTTVAIDRGAHSAASVRR